MDRQQVTGLVVNDKVNVKREFIQKTRAMLNNWEKGGLAFAKREFKKHQPDHKKNNDFVKTLQGNVSFIGNIRGVNDVLFKKMRLRVNILKNSVDYKFITNEEVRKKLTSDNLKMERILLDEVHTQDEKFISFCTSAFHQIENLLNYYYWKRFPEIIDLLQFLIANNPDFKRSYKKWEKAYERFKRIRDLNISVLTYLFEKEFYFEKEVYVEGVKIYYDKRITKLRDIRNDDSHRCSILSYDKAKVLLDFKELEVKKARYLKKHGRFMNLQDHEIDIVYKFDLLKFSEIKDFYFTRKIVKEVGEKIANDLKKRRLN
jgi:hypothetical protein